MLAGERIERANVTRRSETTLNDDLRASMLALNAREGAHCSTRVRSMT